jgi:hypothetical protein
MSSKTKSPRVRAFANFACVNFGLLESLGAGEGARTLDPDLGKVVLYH